MRGGWGRSFQEFRHVYLYLERARHQLGTPRPAFPLPSWRCLHPPCSRPCWAGRGWLQWRSWGKCLGEGKKEIFIFEPLCLFCLKLKEGKIKRVCLLPESLPAPSPERGSEACLSPSFQLYPNCVGKPGRPGSGSHS